MRVVRLAFGALSVTLVALATAGGCGLDPIDAHYTSVDAGMDVSKVRQDSGGLLDAEPSAQPDAAVDASADADAAVDIDAGPCLPPCTSCSGGVCRIDCAGSSCKAIACPPGRPCKVICAENDDCSGLSISCATNQPCTIQCQKAGACKDVALTGAFASKLCVQCDTPNSCEGFNCGLPIQATCAKACGNGGINDSACKNMGTCEACTSFSSCP